MLNLSILLVDLLSIRLQQIMLFELLKNTKPDLVVVVGVAHALIIEEIETESIAVTDGPRLVEALRDDGFTHVVAKLYAHSKTLGVDIIVDADFGIMIRSVINWENDK